MDIDIYCADFKDVDAYSHIDTNNNEQWAWEFLRRNEKYALDLQQHHDEQKIFEESQEKSSYLIKSDPPFKTGAYYIPKPLQGESLQEWTFRVEEEEIEHAILSPARYFGRRWGLDQAIQNTASNIVPIFMKSSFPKALQWSELPPLYAAEEEGFRQDTRILVIGMDLTLDFSSQSDALAKIFESKKANLLDESNKPSPGHIHRGKLLQYLRVVDASRNGLKISEMVQYLAPDADNTYPNKSAEKKLSAQLERGMKYVEKDFEKFLSALTTHC